MSEKIAIITIDTYSSKLLVAESKKLETFAIIDKEIEQIKLNLEQEDHFLKKPQIDTCINVLKNFRKLCEMYNVKKTIAIANIDEQSRPKNLYSFFDEVFATCGFRFELLTPEQRNNYIYSGVINTCDMPKGAIASLTAHSVSLIEYNRRNVLHSNLLDFGPINLLRRYPIATHGAPVAFAKMEKYVETQLSDIDWIGVVDPEFAFIGSGEYFTDLAKMVRKLNKYPLDRDDQLVVKALDASKIYLQLKTMDISSDKKLKGIEEPRADIFVAALAIICGIIKASKRETITITSRGINEGLLFPDFVPSTQEKPISDVVGFGIANNLVDLDDFDYAHSENVYNLSLLLFKQLRVLHKLPRGYVKVLRIASILHDVGKRINNIGYEKYSYDVILGLDIFGADHRELVLASFVAALHGGADLQLAEWIKYKDLLTEEDLDAVKNLGCIVALAANFDRTKSGLIVDINCDILGDSVIMKTISVGDSDYLIHKELGCGKEFEKNFHKKLEIL